jgi:hypothetical protein
MLCTRFFDELVCHCIFARSWTLKNLSQKKKQLIAFC